MPNKPTPERFTGAFPAETTKQLLAPINPRRIKTANGHDHVPGHEVIAHLIRVFGFGNFSYEMVEPPKLIFEQCRDDEVKPTSRWNVCYRATMRLTIFDENHNVIVWYEDSSTGDAQNQTRADGHDLALKSAITLAKKRCAVHLGDQFGLSLYNRGQRDAMVLRTMVAPADLLEEWKDTTSAPGPTGSEHDVSHGVAEQQSLGIDETRDPESANPTEEQTAALANSVGARQREQHVDSWARNE